MTLRLAPAPAALPATVRLVRSLERLDGTWDVEHRTAVLVAVDALRDVLTVLDRDGRERTFALATGMGPGGWCVERDDLRAVKRALWGGR